MVLVKVDYLLGWKWTLAHISHIYRGTDGKVRVVKVCFKTGELKHSITKVAILPIEN